MNTRFMTCKFSGAYKLIGFDTKGSDINKVQLAQIEFLLDKEASLSSVFNDLSRMEWLPHTVPNLSGNGPFLVIFTKVS